MAVRREQVPQDMLPPMPSVVRYLLDELGERLTAVIAGVRDAEVLRGWVDGDGALDAATAERLRAAFEVTQLLRQRSSSELVRLWFRGMNTELDDEAPALQIAKDPVGVRDAARFFLAHG